MPDDMNSTPIPASQGGDRAPIIAGIEITTDAEGRFNLNAIHRASGADAHKKPSEWLRSQTAQDLCAELEQSGNSRFAVEVSRGGASPGTFAHELLAISYAGWISPSFQLKVNQVFLDYRTGKLAPSPAVDPMAILNNPAAMRGLLLTYSEKVLTLESQVEAMRPDVAAHERLVKADGSLNVTEAAKNLGMRPGDLFDWLSHNRWIYKRPGSASWLGYQDKCNRGLLEHKITTVLRADGSEKITEQVRITAKGLSALAKLIPPTAQLVA